MSQLNSITNYFLAKGPRKAPEDPEKQRTDGLDDCHALLLRAAAKRKNAEEEALFRQRADSARTQSKRQCAAVGALEGSESSPPETTAVFFRKYISETAPSLSECGVSSASEPCPPLRSAGLPALPAPPPALRRRVRSGATALVGLPGRLTGGGVPASDLGGADSRGDILQLWTLYCCAQADRETPAWCLEDAKPVCFSELAMNPDAVTALTSWLQGHSDRRKAAKRKRRRRRRDDEEEAEESTSILVLQGPSGAGKTGAVYVAARKLGFRVIEIDAGKVRAGGSVRRLVAEATQSHGVSGATSSELSLVLFDEVRDILL